MTTAPIDVSKYQNLAEAADKLLEPLGIDITPIPDILNDCPLRKGEYTREGLKTTISCDLRFILAGDAEGNATKELEASLTIEVKSQTQKEYIGQLIYPLAENKSLVFDFQFKSGTTSSIFVATSAMEESFPLVNFGGALPGLEGVIPEEIEIGTNYNGLIVMIKSATPCSTGTITRKFLLGLGFNSQDNLNIDLSQLPLIGTQFPADPASNNLTIQLLVATQNFTHEELTNINKFLVELTAPFQIKPPTTASQELTKGVCIAAYLELVGGYKQSWFIPLVKRRTGIGTRSLTQVGNHRLLASTTSTPEESPITFAENGAWLKVQRSFGPVHIEKIGLLYKDGEIQLVPEATLQISQFVLSLNALSVRASLNNFVPYFKLEGFGLEYISDSLEISGAFARIQKDDYEEYLGIASLGMKAKAKTLSLSAVGSFAYYNGQPAFFLYLAVDYPLGGPPFFFVTGLAGGFGYNRSLTVPPFEELPSFPLVTQAVDGPGSIDFDDPAASVGDQLDNLAKYIQLSPGSGFLAIGVKFTSFKLVDSFALLTVAINEDNFELNLIGNSRLVVPPEESGLPPVAQAEILLQARFAPSEGVLSVQAQLTPASYILSGNCRLTGGFAFCIWYAGEHAGDFVITLGGYHPAFKVPSHYPKVPRLGFKWQIDGNTSISGKAYFALCSHAVMAGGELSFDYDDGWAWASLNVGAHFLICWKPYYYDIRVHLHISAGISFVSGSLGVDLHLWGPELGGTFKISFWIASVTVKFGDQGSRDPKPIGWDEFRESFLPPDDEICSIAATEGLVKQLKRGKEEIWILNPKQFALVTDAFIPSKKVFAGGQEKDNSAGFGINPMGIKAGNLETEHRVTITRKDDLDDWVSVEDQFSFEPVTKKAPTALWGEPRLTDKGRLKLPETNGQQFVEGTLSGLRIVPAQEPDPGDTEDIQVAELQYDTQLFDPHYSWETLPAFGASTADDAERRKKIRDTVASNTNRNSILSALGFDPAEMVSVNAVIADAFVFAPLVK
ncbi:MAG: hypothetical protein PUP92_13125 [Rhizonema sp. PD38]|nr:hypothetical protein [Rhizonema sp. PD38]